MPRPPGVIVTAGRARWHQSLDAGPGRPTSGRESPWTGTSS